MWNDSYAENTNSAENQFALAGEENRMMTLRRLLVIVLMLSLSVSLGTRMAAAQSPTAIVVPSPTAEGCDQVPAYLEARQKIMDEFLLDLENVFPDVATPVMEHGDQLFGAIMSMSPEQAMGLAKAYDTVADKIEQIEAPPVADFYNDLQVQLYRLSADVFEETSTSDLSSAGEKFNDQLVAVSDAVDAAGAAATGVCPAFAEVVTLDQTQATR